MRKFIQYSVALLGVIVFFCIISNENVLAIDKPKLSKKNIHIFCGQSKVIKIKNSAKKAKVKWKTTNKSIVRITNSKKKTVKITGVSNGKANVLCVYKLNKKKIKLKCKVKVSQPKNKQQSAENVLHPLITNAPAETPEPSLETSSTHIPEAEVTKTPEVKEPENINPNEYVMDLSKLKSTDNVLVEQNDDGSVTLTWRENADAWTGIGLFMDEPVDFSEYTYFEIDTKEPGSVFCISIKDNDKIDQYGDNAPVGLAYNTQLPCKLELKNILSSDYNGDLEGGQDGDYSNIIGLFLNRNGDSICDENVLCINSIKFTK